MMNTVIQGKSYSGRIISITLLFSISYSILRYNIIGDIPWKDLSLFILNKGISLSSIVLLSLNFSLGPLKNLGMKIPEFWLNARKSIGMSGFMLALLHGIFSFVLLNPNYYSSFFLNDGTLSGKGSISLLGGILSFILLWIYNISFKTFLREDKNFIKFITSRSFLIYAMLFTGVHLFFMGYSGWMEPSKWQSGLPPISLISFLFFLISYIINLLGRK